MNRQEIREYLRNKKVFRSNGNLNTMFLRHIDNNILFIVDNYEGNTTQEKIWNVFYDRPACEICGSPTEFISFNKGYKKYCSPECKKEYLGKKSREMWKNLDKEAIQKKKEETNLKKYGVKNPGINKKVQEKMKATCLKKYGAEYYFSTEESQEKIRRTNREKYGVDYALSNQEVIDKRKETLMKKYGVENSKQIPGLIERQYKEFEKDLKEDNSIFHLLDCELLDNYQGQYKDDKAIPYHFRCKKCGKTFVDYFYKGTRRNITCKSCYPTVNSSNWENELFIWLDSIIEVEKNNRSVLKGKELDIYIPSKKIAIECDGVYYHSEKFQDDKYYHLKKTIECENQGIRLLHIFEDEWIYKKEIIKSIIKSSLGLYDQKIGARECKIHEGKCDQFFEENHLQGKGAGKYCYYLTYNNEIVAALLIGKPRFNKNYDYEITRFVCKLNTRVVGAFNKLFKYFRKDHPGSVVTYSDRRLFTGNVYRKSGFNELEPSDIGYSYSSGVNRISRYEMTNQKLLSKFPESNKNLPERLIANNRGYYRIFDCGQYRFEIN